MDLFNMVQDITRAHHKRLGLPTHDGRPPSAYAEALLECANKDLAAAMLSDPRPTLPPEEVDFPIRPRVAVGNGASCQIIEFPEGV